MGDDKEVSALEYYQRNIVYYIDHYATRIAKMLELPEGTRVWGANVGDMTYIWNRQPEISYNFVLAGCRMTPMPGCSNILISNDLSVNYLYRAKGLGSFFHRLRLMAAGLGRIGMVICTSEVTNNAENAILKQYKWDRIPSFENFDTKHEIWFWRKRLSWEIAQQLEEELNDAL